MTAQLCEQTCRIDPFNSDFDSLIKGCLKIEQDRNLSTNSIKELKRYLTEFIRYCKTKNIYSSDDLSPDFLRQYVEHRYRDSGPNLKKAVVGSLRKFGKYLSLIQKVADDPARNLKHLKFNVRSELPDYLSETELRKLLEYAAKNKTTRDFAISSLLASTGLRPKEIISIKLHDIYLNKFL